MSDDANKQLSPWHPIKDPVDLKTLGKLNEELGECTAAVSRCIIQGVFENEPVTGKKNIDWLEDEIADVMAGFALTIERFKLDKKKMEARTLAKYNRLKEWHSMA